MSAGTKTPRRRFFVDGTVQGALIRRLVCHWILAMLVLAVFLLATQILIEGVYLPLSYHVAAIWENYGLGLISILALLPVFIYDIVKLSHRFAGPMVSFRRTLHQLAEGENIDQIDFRKRDFWQPLTKDLNRIAERLNAVNPTIETTGQDDQPDDPRVAREDSQQLVQS